MKKKRLDRLKKVENEVEEELKNWPNFLTLLRVILTFVLIYVFIFDFNVKNILIIFFIAAITDFLDGQIARRFKQVTKFGAKFDILADRFLWLTTGLFILIFFPIYNIFNQTHVSLMVLIMTREILCFPFVFFYFVLKKNKLMTVAKWSGKVTTFLQGIAIPLLILSAIGYSFFDFSVYLIYLTSMSGIWATFDYLKGIGFLNN